MFVSAFPPSGGYEMAVCQRDGMFEEAVPISANPAGLMGIYCSDAGLDHDPNKHMLRLLDVLNIHELLVV